MITKKELEKELFTLKYEFGLTQEELEGYLEFFKEAFIINESKIQILNFKRKKNGDN